MDSKQNDRVRSRKVNGEIIRFLREKRGWTQERFAALSGYSERLIRKAEANGSLSPDTIEILAEALSDEQTPVLPEDILADPKEIVARFMCWFLSPHRRDKKDKEPYLLTCNDIICQIVGDSAQIPFAGTYHSKAGLEEFREKFLSVIKCMDILPQLFVAGNHVMASCEDLFEYIHLSPSDSTEARTSFIFKFQIERGEIVLLEVIYDTLSCAQNIAIRNEGIA